MHEWMVRYYSDAAIENAIIAQQAMFPYHFVEGGAQLNELGQRDLAILAEHYSKQPGTLHI